MAGLTAEFAAYIRQTCQYDNDLTDPRKQPRIALGTIVSSIMFLPLSGASSLLSIDQQLRLPSVRKYFGGGVSDTHMVRVLKELNLDELRAMNYRISTADAFTYQLGEKRLHIGIVDGSVMAGQYVCCLQLVRNREQRVILDLEPYENRGKELPASKRLLDRAGSLLPDVFLNLIMADGLYVTQYHFNQCLQRGCDVLVKTKEKDLLIIKDADGCFDHYQDYADTIEHVTGTDAERNKTFEIFRLGNFPMAGVKKLLNIARITETDIHTGESETYYVVTTRDDLVALEMRELSYLRWSIENIGFKLLNSLCHSKHGYLKQKAACLNLLFLLITGFNTLLLFLTSHRSECRQLFPGMKSTIKFLARTLAASLFATRIMPRI